MYTLSRFDLDLSLEAEVAEKVVGSRQTSALSRTDLALSPEHPTKLKGAQEVAG
jgi:hypothetical protein